MFMTMTGEQLRAARAMLRWEQAELARRADVSIKTIKRLEAMSGPLDARSNWSIRHALELGGIEFLPADDSRSRGDGVRFQKDRTATLRHKLSEEIATWLEINLKMAVEKDEDFFERPADEITEVITNAVREKLKTSIEYILHKETPEH